MFIRLNFQHPFTSDDVAQFSDLDAFLRIHATGHLFEQVLMGGIAAIHRSFPNSQLLAYYADGQLRGVVWVTLLYNHPNIRLSWLAPMDILEHNHVRQRFDETLRFDVCGRQGVRTTPPVKRRLVGDLSPKTPIRKHTPLFRRCLKEAAKNPRRFPAPMH